MNYFHDMVDNIHQKRIWRPSNQCGSICLHLRRHIWNSRVHVTSSGHEGTPAWTKAKPSSSRGFHRKQIPTCWSTDISQSCRICHFHWKGQCASEIQLLNTTHDKLRCRHGKQMTPVWRSSISHSQSLAKNSTRIFATGGGGDSDTRHRDNVVTWQRRLRLLSIQTLNCL